MNGRNISSFTECKNDAFNTVGCASGRASVCNNPTLVIPECFAAETCGKPGVICVAHEK